jgi:hypothetical protein
MDSKLNPNLSQQRYAKQSQAESVDPSNNQQKNDPKVQDMYLETSHCRSFLAFLEACSLT